MADIARKAQDSTIVVLSKWDITETELEDVRPRLESRLRQRPPVVTISAKTGRGISRLLDRIEQLYEKHAARIGTGELNRFLAELREAREPPSRNGKRLNLLYGTQVQARPPRFRFFVNDPGPDHPRLRLLGREPAARPLRAAGRAGVDRLRPPLMRAAVVGAGAWGTAFACVLASRGHDVTLAARDPEQARAIEETGRNPRYLPNVDLEGITATTVDDPSLAGVDLHVVAVPSHAFAQVVRALPGAAPVLSLTKGLDPESGGRLSELVERRAVAVLSGPNFAEEIAEGLPAAAVIASKDANLAEELQQAVNSMAFRVYVNDDLVGVELCAAAKNVIALAAGGVDGLGLGDNAKAALIARGLAEMARLGEACGGRTETFSGLAGMGDLMVTCWSRQGRNRRAGELIAQGASPEEAAAEIGTVEGLTTAPVLRELSHRVGIELPITEGVCHVLDGQDLHDLAAKLMGRQPTRE